jgi:L,D-transpeptidase ErfK/SrfK
VLTVLVGMTPARAERFPLLPETDLVGEIGHLEARHEDTLAGVASRFDIGYEAIKRANPGVDPWLPGAGTRITLPSRFILPNTPREGLVLNLPEMRLYYYPKRTPGRGTEVMVFPVSIGDMDWSTPLGLTRVVAKIENPTWYPPVSVRTVHARDGDQLPSTVPPGADNPLGEYALKLAIPRYLIHGTNRPNGIGMRVTHGCVRLRPDDIRTLYAEVEPDTPVRIVDLPYKAGWEGAVLFLEVHRPLDGKPGQLTSAVRAIITATAAHRATIDWDKVQRTVEEMRGIPVAISRGAR